MPWASCRAMGIFVERASGVERASCPFQFPGGQYAHATPINPLIDIRWIAEKPGLMIVIFLASWK
ncbi:hypothetical protein [Moorena producens]|uniref:hypothetical protein n=1 Tax=Moorena producens TaxID=1155739 RepID=UPI0011EA6B26|nr:hypothetical protein [Moorena producens]